MAGGPAYAKAQAENLAKVQEYLAEQARSTNPRTQEAYRENVTVTNLRENAPSSLESNTPQEKAVRDEAVKETEQAYKQGGYSRTGSSGGAYAGQREKALKEKSGFDYNAVRSAFYTPPETYVNDKGQTVVRDQSSKLAIKPTPSLTSIQSPSFDYYQYEKSKEVKPTSQAKTVTPTVTIDKETQGNLDQFKSQGYQTVEIYDQKGNLIGRSNISNAGKEITRLSNTFGAVNYKGTNQTSTNPELEQAFIKSYQANVKGFGDALQGKGGYVNTLIERGVLTKEDVDKINQTVSDYNTAIGKQNIEIRQANIAQTQNQIKEINTNLNEAKAAGVNQVDVLDKNGNVIGSVNPQNLGLARLQTLKLLNRQGGTSLRYTPKQTTQSPGVESTLTTYNPKNELTAFVGGAIGSFGEIGLIGLGAIAKITGKEIKVPGSDYTVKPTGVLAQASERTEKTFGKQTIDQVLSGEKVDLSSGIAIASLAGFGASLVATGGIGGVKAVAKGPLSIYEAVKGGKVAVSIAEKELKEGSLVSNLEKVKGTSTLYTFEQGTAGKSVGATAKMGFVKEFLARNVLKGGKETVESIRPLSKEVTLPAKGSEGTAKLSYSVISTSKGGITSIVKPGITELTPQEVAIKGVPPEVAQKMGLVKVESEKGFPIYRGKVTAENIPILQSELEAKNIKPVFDILQYPTKDIAKGGGRYGLLSRESSILSSNAFERVVRPSVIRYFEAKVELEKEAPKAAKAFKPYKPMGKIEDTLGGAGGAGKAKQLTEQEKSLVKSLTKTGLEQVRKSKPNIVNQVTRVATYSQIRTRQRQREREETVYLTKPGEKLGGASKSKTIELTKGIQKEDLLGRISIEDLTRPRGKTKEKSFTGLISKTSSITGTKPKVTTKTQTKQVTKQITKQTFKTTPPENPFKQQPEPTGKKKPPFDIIGAKGRSGLGGPFSSGGNRKGYIGNVPEFAVVGVYKRTEISYGGVSTKSARPTITKLTSKISEKGSNKLLRKSKPLKL